MLRNTQDRFERGAGTPFLIFGYLTLAVSIAVWSLVKTTGKSFPTLMVVSLLMFSGEAITGAILKLRYVRIMGLIGIALSFAIPFLSGIEPIVLAALSLIAMIIPGHIMNAQARKRDAETPQIDGHV